MVEVGYNLDILNNAVVCFFRCHKLKTMENEKVRETFECEKEASRSASFRNCDHCSNIIAGEEEARPLDQLTIVQTDELTNERTRHYGEDRLWCDICYPKCYRIHNFLQPVERCFEPIVVCLSKCRAPIKKRVDKNNTCSFCNCPTCAGLPGCFIIFLIFVTILCLGVLIWSITRALSYF